MGTLNREVYPNAPLVQVVIEIRWPPTPELLSGEGLLRLRQALRPRLPLTDQIAEQSVTFSLGSLQAPQQAIVPRTRFTSRDRSTVVDVSNRSLTIETTTYNRYEALRDVAATALQALAEANRPDGLERIGLRYIDEVRVPTEAPGDVDWSPWIHEDLLHVPGPTAALRGLDVVTWEGVVQLDSGADRVVFRYGPRVGRAVDPHGTTGPTSESAAGAFFLLDLDSFHLLGPDVPEFEPAAVLALCDRLHEPVRGIFEASITDRLRDEVLRKGVAK